MSILRNLPSERGVDRAAVGVVRTILARDMVLVGIVGIIHQVVTVEVVEEGSIMRMIIRGGGNIDGVICDCIV